MKNKCWDCRKEIPKGKVFCTDCEKKDKHKGTDTLIIYHLN